MCILTVESNRRDMLLPLYTRMYPADPSFLVIHEGRPVFVWQGSARDCENITALTREQFKEALNANRPAACPEVADPGFGTSGISRERGLGGVSPGTALAGLGPDSRD